MLDWTEATERTRELRSDGSVIVFTNGCFDLLHAGHVDLLRRCAGMGDALVVGLNSDDSVRRLKGAGRPINNLKARASVLKAVRWVDMVVPFTQDTPAELIALLEPDVLVKGGDYRPDQVVGRKTVEAAGGKVVTVPLLEGYSTSHLISRIRSGS